MKKPPTAAQLEKQKDEFNRTFPVGTPVKRYKLINPLSDPMETETRSEAFIMGGHSVMVMVKGVSGGVCIESVTPRDPIFEFAEFNPFRHRRRKEAARIRIVDAFGEMSWLWMGKNDLIRNISEWGEQPAFVAALEAYKKA